MRASKRSRHKLVWSKTSALSDKAVLGREAARERIRGLIAFNKRKISEGKQTSARQADTFSTTGSYAIRTAMHRTLADVEERERELPVYEEREKSLTAEIEAMSNPFPAQLAERAKHQDAVAALLIKRGTKDAALGALVPKVRKILKERAALTAEVRRIAALIDFAPDEAFDAGRFSALESVLPVDILASSREWIASFLGIDEGEKKPYTVGRAGAVLPETLYDSGVYRPGEIVFLSKERAKMLPVDEEAKPLPGPVEMEIQAGNSFQPTHRKPEEADSIPVSGFPLR